MKILAPILMFFLSSCCGLHTEVKYHFENITVKRVDECGKTTFKYTSGKLNPSNEIWAEYSGMSGGFSGYLEFHENGKVTLYSGDGYFQTDENADTTVFNYKRILARDTPELGGPVCEILLSTRYEQERNAKHGTTLEIEYNIDENEWW